MKLKGEVWRTRYSSIHVLSAVIIVFLILISFVIFFFFQGSKEGLSESQEALEQRGGFLGFLDKVFGIFKGREVPEVQLGPSPRIILDASNLVADVYVDSSSFGGATSTVMKWSLANIPLGYVIDSAKLCGYVSQSTIVGPGLYGISPAYVPDQVWTEGLTSTEAQVLYNSRTIILPDNLNTTLGYYQCINVTAQLRTSYSNGDGYFSVWIESQITPQIGFYHVIDSVQLALGLCPNGPNPGQCVRFNSRNAGSNLPYLELNPPSDDFYGPVVNLRYPVNYGATRIATNYFYGDFSAINTLASSVLNVWNSNGVLVATAADVLSGNSDFSNLSLTLPAFGDYEWNYYVCDNTGTCAWARQNFTLRYTSDSVSPNIFFIDPTPADFSWTLEKNVMINISIIESELGNVLFNWNKVNYGIYDRSLILMANFDNRSSLGESMSKVADLSIYSNNGTPAGYSILDIIYSDACKYGGCYNFGGEEHIDFGNPTNEILDPELITIAAWIYPTSAVTDVYGYIVSKDRDCCEISNPGGYGFLLKAGMQMRGEIWPNSQQSGQNPFYFDGGPNIEVNKWQYVVMSFNGTNIELYLDGNLVGVSESRSYDTIKPSIRGTGLDSLFVGRMTAGFPIGNWYSFPGKIDEVRIWSRPLNASEIQEQYFANLNKFDSLQWYLSVNQSYNSTTGLNQGVYSYQGCASDISDNWNCTEERQIRILETPPCDIKVEKIPGGDMNATYNEFFNITVNVSYTGGECGPLNVSLNYLANLTLNSSYDVADVYLDNDAPDPWESRRAAYLKWDISSLLSNKIIDTKLCLLLDLVGGPQTPLLAAYVNDQSWDEGSPISVFQAQTRLNRTVLNTLDLNTPTNTYHCLNYTAQLRQSYAVNGNTYFTTVLDSANAEMTSSDMLFVANNRGLVIGQGIPGIYFVDRENNTLGPQFSGATPYLGIWYLPFYVTSEILVSMITGAKPFYTITSNPYTVTLLPGESREILFWLNATGDIGSNHTLFAATTPETSSLILNASEPWIVSIVSTLDTDPPKYYNLTENPSDPAVYSPLQIYEFNATWIDNVAVDTVRIEFDRVNYSVSNAGNNVYRFSIVGLAAGSYKYFWWANDTSGNVNRTDGTSYTVRKSSVIENGNLILRLNGLMENLDVVYPSLVNASAISNLGSPLLYRDGTDVTFMNHLFEDLAAGYYNFTAYLPETENYTELSVTLFANVSKRESVCVLTSNSPVTYPSPVSVSGTCTNPEAPAELFRDGVGVTNPYTDVLGAGSYEFLVSVIETQNYSSASDLETFIVEKNSSYIFDLNLIILPSETVSYGTTTTATGSGCPVELTCTLHRDGNTVSNPDIGTFNVGSYLYNYSTPGNQNYIAGSIARTLLVQPAETGTLVIATPASPIFAGTMSNFSCWNSAGLPTILYINGVDKSDEKDVYVLRPAGNYIVNCTAIGNVNYLGSSDQILYIIDTFASVTQCSIHLVPGWNHVSAGCVKDINISTALMPIYGEYPYLLDWNESRQLFDGWSELSGLSLPEVDVQNKSFFIYYIGVERDLEFKGPPRGEFYINMPNVGWYSPVWPYQRDEFVSASPFYGAEFQVILVWNESRQLFDGWFVNGPVPSNVYVRNGKGYFVTQTTDNGERRIYYP